jgi:hypothetical protein
MAYNEQEMENFLKRDMIEFLDSRRTDLATQEQEKDYYEKIKQALLKRDNETACNFLEEAVEEYNDLSETNVYKQIKFNKITDVVQLIKKYLETTKETGRIAEEIAAIDKSKELETPKIARITALDYRKKEKQQKEFEAQTREYEEKEQTKTKIKKLSEEIFVTIRKKDFQASIIKYKQLRVLFEEFPGKYAEEKKQIYNDLIAIYLQIQMMKKDLKENQEKIVIAAKKVEVTQQKEEGQYLDIAKIKELVQQIKSDVQKTKFDDAKQNILEIKHGISKIPDKYKNIRANLNSKIDILNQRVDFAKRIYFNQINKKT